MTLRKHLEGCGHAFDIVANFIHNELPRARTSVLDRQASYFALP